MTNTLKEIDKLGELAGPNSIQELEEGLKVAARLVQFHGDD